MSDPQAEAKKEKGRVKTVTIAEPERGTKSVASGAGGNGSGKEDKSGSLVASSSTSSLTPSQPNYATHPLFLGFLDSTLEQEYCDFAYLHTGFIGGKLWHFIAIGIALLSFGWYRTWFLGWGAGQQLGEPYWVSLTASTCVTVLTFGCLFLPPFYKWRETLYLLSLFLHWPSFTIAYLFGLKHYFVYMYPFLTGCFWFCTMVVQARFSRAIWFLTISPLLTLIISTLTFPAKYWDSHNVAEITYWIYLVFPLAMLAYFEKNSRRAFIAMRISTQRISQVEDQISKTQHLIATLFPKTPTKDILTQGTFMTRSKEYPNSALVVTDIKGFTAWTSRTQPKTVIATLGAMFEKMDALLLTHNVEKVSTVGDSFVGAIFGREGMPTDSICRLTVSAIQYGIAILPTAQDLSMRVGLHLCEVTGGFIGSAPPKFDVFGPGVEYSKEMESGGVPDKVHISTAMLEYALRLGQPENGQKTPMGVATACWIPHVAVKDSSMSPIDKNGIPLPPAAEEEGSQGSQSHSASGTPRHGNPFDGSGNGLGGTPSVVLTIAVPPVATAEPDGSTDPPSTDLTEDEIYMVCEALLSLNTVVTNKKLHRPGIEAPRLFIDNLVPLQSDSTFASQSSPTFEEAGKEQQKSIPMLLDADDGELQPSISQASRTSPSAVPPRHSDSGVFLHVNRRTSTSTFNMMTPSGVDKRVSFSALSTGPSASAAPSPLASRDGSAFVASRERRGSADTITSAAGLTAEAVAFHPLLLYFKNPSDERLFKKFLAMSGLLDRCFFVFSLMLSWLAFSHMLLGCFESLRNRLLYAFILLIVIMVVVVLRKGTRFRFFNLFTLGSVGIISLLSLFQTTNCDYGFYYTGVIMGMYCQIGLTMSQFMLNLELRIRLALAVVFSLVGVLFNVVRTEGIKDKSFPYDPIWVTALPALGFVSYFADYTLRSAFASARQLRALLKKTMGKQHQAAKAALDVMLPPFVSARLLSSSSADKAMKEAEEDEEDRGPKSEQSIAENGKEESVDLGGSLTDRQFSSQNLLGDESQGGMLDTASFTNSEKLWEFSGVCVMFCYFKVKMYEGGSEHHRIETIGQAIQQIERILVAEGIHKIKTIGPSVLCVSGIQGEPDAVCNMVTACQAIRKQVFGTRLDWDFTIGLNFGPCFGAVLGTTNLMFDIFGDTVNTASRMQSNAPNRAIQVSTSVYDTLTGDLTSANGLAGSMSLTSGVHSPLHSSPTSTKTRNNRFKFTKREPIQVKGKGLLDAYLLLPEEGEVETDK